MVDIIKANGEVEVVSEEQVRAAVEQILKRKAYQQKYSKSPEAKEARAKYAETHKKAYEALTDEEKEARREHNREYRNRPEVKEKMAAKRQDPVFKAAQKEKRDEKYGLQKAALAFLKTPAGAEFAASISATMATATK